MTSRCALFAAFLKAIHLREHSMRVVELWAVGRRSFVPQCSPNQEKSRRNTRTRRILRQAFRGCNARAVLHLQHKSAAKNRVLRRTGAANGSGGSGPQSASRHEPSWLQAGSECLGMPEIQPHRRRQPVVLQCKYSAQQSEGGALNRLPDTCIRPAPTHRSAVTPGFPPMSCVPPAPLVRSPG